MKEVAKYIILVVLIAFLAVMAKSSRSWFSLIFYVSLIVVAVPVFTASPEDRRKLLSLLDNAKTGAAKTLDPTTRLVVAIVSGDVEAVAAEANSFNVNGRFSDNSKLTLGSINDIVFISCWNEDAMEAEFKYGPENYFNFTPLMCAASKGNISIIKKLIDLGAEVNASDSIGMTPLFYALGAGHEEAAGVLINAGARVNSKTTPPAALKGVRGADEFIRWTRWGVTPLMLAAMKCSPAIASRLIEKGADVSAFTYKVNPASLARKPFNRTDLFPLKCAVDNKNIQTAKLLVEKGAKFDLEMAGGYEDCLGYFQLFLLIGKKGGELPALLEKARKDLSVTYKKGEESMIWGALIKTAAENGFSETLFHLIDISPDPREFCGETSILDYFFYHNDLQTAAKLLQIGFACSSISWTNAVSRAEKDPAALKMLLSGDEGKKHFAAWGGKLLIEASAYAEFQPKTLKILIEAGAGLDHRDESGSTPLIAAARKGHAGTVKFLIENGADTDGTDNEGSTPIIIAALSGREDVVRRLAECGADLDISNSKGDTALIGAIRFFKSGVAKYLIEKGADTKIANREGKTAKDVAASKKMNDIVKMLG